MDLATLQAQLAAAQTAYHNAMVSGQASQMSYTLGGTTSATRTFVAIADLRGYIQELQQQIARLQGLPSGRVVRFIP